VVTSPTPRLPAGERLRRAGIAAWSIIGLLILGYVLVRALVMIRVIFPPLVLAILIIYLLNPIVTRLEQRGVKRTVGTLASYIVVLGGLTLIIFASAPLISRQVSNFSDQWPQFKLDLARSVQDLAADLDRSVGININTDRVTCLLAGEEAGTRGLPSQGICDERTREFRAFITEQTGRITEIGFSVLEVLLIFILAPLLALYLLIDLPQLQRDVLNLVPVSHRQEFADLGSKVGRTVGGFMRGQFLVALIVGILASIGFWIIGLPFWLVIGAIAGVTNLIPLVGPFIGGGLGLIVGTVTEGVGLGLQAGIVALVVQQIDNHIISPNVMKRTVQLHPVTVMLSILAGGALAGFWGVLLGVPTVAVVKLLMSHFWTTRVLGAADSPYGSPGREPPSIAPDKSDRHVGGGADEGDRVATGEPAVPDKTG
jgi:predicted PurR-regulated permease PerM